MQTSFPKDKIRVVLLEGIHARGRAALEREGFTVTAHAKALSGAMLHDALGEAHVVGIRSKTQLTGAVLGESPRLLAVGCFCIGTNQVDLKAACMRGVPVFNSPFSNTRSVAELTVAEVVALCRRLFEKSTQLHAGVWDKSAAGAHEVRGKVLGIVGYGHIGSQVSVLAESMGMRVVYYDIVPKQPLGNARAARSLDELLELSDVVTLHVPATRQTERLIGAPQLARMKPGAALINNARGSVVDLPALAGALKEKRVCGAALDVFPQEPEGQGDRFVSEVSGLANVILTPHIGGSTEEAQEQIAEDVAGKLLKFVNNGSTTGAVNVPEVELPEQGVRDGGESELAAAETARRPAAGGGAPAPLGFVGPRGAGPAPEAPVADRRHHRILHFHRNVPGVLSKMHGLIAELGVNIIAEYLQTNRDVGYVVLDVDPTHGDRVLAGLRSIPETIRVRMLW